MKLNNVNYFIIFISILFSIYLIESFLEISDILSKIKKQKIELEFKHRINLANNEGVNYDKRSITKPIAGGARVGNLGMKPTQASSVLAKVFA